MGKISINAPDETYNLMEKLAENKGMSISAFVKHCITVYITAYAKKLQQKSKES